MMINHYLIACEASTQFFIDEILERLLKSKLKIMSQFKISCFSLLLSSSNILTFSLDPSNSKILRNVVWANY